MPNSGFDVCIRGAGIVGRTLALKLGQAKLRVALVDERLTVSAPAADDIRAYALNHASHALLQGLRCWPDAGHATPVRQMQIRADAGGALSFDANSLPESVQSAQKNGQAPANKALAWIVDVPALEARLNTALQFQATVELVSEPVPTPLTAICEGKFSTSREQLAIQTQAFAYPQHAIATRVRASQPHKGVASQWFAGHDILALLPLGGEDSADYAVVWSTEAARVQQLIALDELAFAAELQQFIDAPASEPAAASNPSVPQGTQFEVIGKRAHWPLRLAQTERWCGDMPPSEAAQAHHTNHLTENLQRWVLLGDAAHTVHPLAGSGLNLGLGDVATLSQLLLERPAWRSVADWRLLRNYERERKSALLPYATATDSLQWLFWQDQPWLQMARNWGMRGFSATGPLKDWLVRQAMST